MSGRSELLRTSWTQVAKGYQQHFVHRFAPWTAQTLAALDAAGPCPAQGTVLVPACGPGQELPLLAARLPHHRIMGVDLAEGMVELANQTIEEHRLGERVRAVVGDASAVDPALLPLACVVSCFGLQQMPEPAQVLARWAAALAPGGLLAVCFWPPAVEEEGPWKRLADLTAPAKPLQAADWDADIPGAAVRAGAEVLLDARPAHAMEWPSAGAFWDAMVLAGPWHSRLLQRGEAHLEGVRRAFMAGVADPDAPLSHAPSARLVVLRRRGGGGGTPPAAAL